MATQKQLERILTGKSDFVPELVVTLQRNDKNIILVSANRTIPLAELMTLLLQTVQNTWGNIVAAEQSRIIQPAPGTKVD